MQYTIHSHITYKFEVLQNNKDNNDFFVKKKKLNKILYPSKEKKSKKNALKSKSIKTIDFSCRFCFC